VNVNTGVEDTDEDTADREISVRAVVNCRLCGLMVALQLLVVTVCKCSIWRITIPNPVYIESICVSIFSIIREHT
jgi:hypothetical protein